IHAVARALGCSEHSAALLRGRPSAAGSSRNHCARAHLSGGAAVDAAIAEQLARHRTRDTGVSGVRATQTARRRVRDRRWYGGQDLSARRAVARDLSSWAIPLRALDGDRDGGRARAAAARSLAGGARGAVPLVARGGVRRCAVGRRRGRRRIVRRCDAAAPHLARRELAQLARAARWHGAADAPARALARVEMAGVPAPLSLLAA